MSKERLQELWVLPENVRQWEGGDAPVLTALMRHLGGEGMGGWTPRGDSRHPDSRTVWGPAGGAAGNGWGSTRRNEPPHEGSHRSRGLPPKSAGGTPPLHHRAR